MGHKMNKQEYAKCIEDDIDFLKRHLPESLFKCLWTGHIIEVLKASINMLYDNFPSNLDEAAEEYRKEVCEHPMYYTYTKQCFKAGAKWDKEQMMKEHIPKEHSELTELEYALYDLLASNNITNHSDEEVVETAKVAAMDLMNIAKAEMMKESVEVEITKDNRGNNVVRAGVFNKDFEYGDKVRIIIVKEDRK